MLPERGTIALIVDHPRRDLEGVALVAYQLARRGLSSALVPMYSQAIDMALLDVDCAVVNYVRPNNYDLLQGYLHRGLKVFVLDTEGAMMIDDGEAGAEGVARRIRESGIARELSGYFVWGERTRALLAAWSGIEADAVKVTGCPRFDYCRPPWDRLLRREASGYVLANTNFALANPAFSGSSAKEREVMRLVGFSDQEADSLIASTRKIFERFLGELEAFAAALPQQRFVVRPHPFENVEVYRRRFAAHSNVSVDNRGPVLPMIRHARCVVHVNCGTSIEATMLGKLPIQLEYINDPAYRDAMPLPTRVSRLAQSRDDAIACLRDIDGLAAGWDFEGRYREQIWPNYYENDGRAAERVADAIATQTPAAPRRPGLAAVFSASRVRPTPRHRLLGLAGALLGSRGVDALRALGSQRRLKRFSAEDVRQLLSEIAAADGAAAAPEVCAVRAGPLRMPLASVIVRPRRAVAGRAESGATLTGKVKERA